VTLGNQHGVLRFKSFRHRPCEDQRQARLDFVDAVFLVIILILHKNAVARNKCNAIDLPIARNARWRGGAANPPLCFAYIKQGSSPIPYLSIFRQHDDRTYIYLHKKGKRMWIGPLKSRGLHICPTEWICHVNGNLAMHYLEQEDAVEGGLVPGSTKNLVGSVGLDEPSKSRRTNLDV
jgi:hypothetical protein